MFRILSRIGTKNLRRLRSLLYLNIRMKSFQVSAMGQKVSLDKSSCDTEILRSFTCCRGESTSTRCPDTIMVFKTKDGLSTCQEIS